MELIIAYKDKGEKPVVLFSSTNKQEVLDKMEEIKGQNYLTEIWTLGMRKKAYYGKAIEAEPKKAVTKKVAKKKSVTVTE